MTKTTTLIISLLLVCLITVPAIMVARAAAGFAHNINDRTTVDTKSITG